MSFLPYCGRSSTVLPPRLSYTRWEMERTVRPRDAWRSASSTRDSVSASRSAVISSGSSTANRPRRRSWCAPWRRSCRRCAGHSGAPYTSPPPAPGWCGCCAAFPAPDRPRRPRRGQQPRVVDQSGDGHKTQRQPLHTEIVANPVGAERFVTLPHPLHLPPASERGGSPPGSLSWTRYTACPAWRQRRRPPPASVRRSDTRKTRPRSPPWRPSAAPAGRALRFLPPWCMMGKTCVRRAVPPRSLQ